MQSKTALAGGPVGPLSGSFPFTQSPTSHLFSRLVAAIQSGWAAMDRWHREKEAIELLHQMDDHMLSDMGIPRSEIEFVIRNGRRPGE